MATEKEKSCVFRQRVLPGVLDSEVERAALAAASKRDEAFGARSVERRRRGIVHTPPQIARFVARAADEALRIPIGCTGGLSDPRVALVDPSCGPGVFLAAALACSRRTAPSCAVGIDVDPDAIGAAHEVLDAPAALAGWPIALRVGNTLSSLDPWGRLLAEGTAVVVLGNPPWAGRSANRDGIATAELLEDFRRDAHGAPLSERKIGVLSDDYVRFLRWSAEIARRASGGAVVALVTNASFLDGPVHRGMRASLMRWFDAIDIVDLGGSALVARSSRAGEGDADENVFGVRPGVAITIATRLPGRSEPRRCRVRYTRLRGSRAEKLDVLGRSAPSDLALPRVPADPPLSRFGPAPRRERAYARWVALADAMPFHREGVQTNRDDVAVAIDRETLLDRLRRLVAGRTDRDLEPALRRLEHFDPVRARASVRDALERDPDGTLGLSARPIAYRPLDDRWVAPIAALCHRPRPDLARAVQASDLVLVTVRKDRGERPWSHFGAASALVDNCYLSSRSSCRARAFPTSGPDGAPNIEPRFAARVSDALGVRVGAPDFARYSLAVLASPAYRARFDAALRADYPRVPIAPNAAAYRALVEAGDAIARACASSATAPSTARIDAVPDDAAARIERPRISADEGWIELGPGVRVTAVPRGGLELVLGHVRVVEAWVASRRGRVLDATACREIADVVDRAAAIAAHIARLDALVAPLL